MSRSSARPRCARKFGAIRLRALIAGADDDQVDAAGEYCRSLGTAFHQAQRELVRECIKNGDESHFDAVLSAVTSIGTLDYTRRAAVVAANRTATAIADLPETGFKQNLLQLCTFAVDRNH